MMDLVLAAALYASTPAPASASGPGPYADCVTTDYGMVWCPGEHGAYVPGRGTWVDTGGADMVAPDPGYAQQRHEDGTTGTRRHHH